MQRQEPYLEVELLSGCAKSLEYIQGRVAAIHVFRVEVTLHKFTCLFFDPGFDFVSGADKNEIIFLHIAILTAIFTPVKG